MTNLNTSNKIILGINRGHNSSISLISGGELLLHIENERLSNLKYDQFSFNAINLITDYVDHIDCLALAGVSTAENVEVFSQLDYYSEIILRLGKSFYNHGFERYDFSKEHHKLHAACAFYNSGFDQALCIIKDGMGSEYKLTGSEFLPNSYGRELSSSFVANKESHSFQLVSKHVAVNFALPQEPYHISENVFLSNSFSEGLAFQKTSKAFGFHELDAGKVMGMSSYGNNDQKEIYQGKLLNKNIFKYSNNSLRDGFVDNLFHTFEDKADFALSLQQEIQVNVLNEILDLIKKTGQNNICLSGGFFLNCVANNFILKNLPKHINVYVEPLSSDAGTSLGAAMLCMSNDEKRFYKKQTTLYYGPKYNYKKQDVLKKCTQSNVIQETSPLDVAKLLDKNKIIAVYQGQSEAGPRALGNRSIVFNPTVVSGKDIVNSVKKREWFRPFAASVLKEHASEWFDISTVIESNFMMYAVDALPNIINKIPAVLHVDNTCRIQTVSAKQNYYFYNLIKEFYNLTEIPMLLNTSFNLAGDCIVETIEDALYTFNNSTIDFLWLPEYNILVSKN